MKMKANVYDLNGKAKGKIELPGVFESPLRSDLIKRAVLALQSQKRQPYGTDPMAGMRTSAHYHGARRKRYSMMNRNLARMPRLHDTSPHLSFRPREVPQTVKGRVAHPPKAEKKWEQKINKKELQLALRSAIAATAKKDSVSDRGHRIDGLEFPIILENEMQSIKKTKDFEKLLISLGLADELERCKIKSIRAGKGKMRGRRYNKRKGPLIVVVEDNGIVKAAKNIPGVDVELVDRISVESLAPGAHPGRLTIWSQSAVEKFKEW